VSSFPKNLHTCISILILLLVCQYSYAEPPRVADYVNHIAVQVNGSWQYFAPNTENAPHRVSRNEREIEFVVGVPEYLESQSQILFVRTAYLDNQPVSLFRNTSNPWLRWWGNWRSTGLITKDSYLRFHLSNVNELDAGLPEYKPYFDWHDTSLWSTNEQSHSFVNRIAQLHNNQESVAAERLLRVQGGRPLMSWIPVTANYPKRGELFRITTAYSGTLNDNPSVQVLEFYFLNSD
jgi:hypothetical protein